MNMKKMIWTTGALALLTSTVALAGTGTPPLDDQAVAAAVRGNEEFALKLYAGLREREGNLFLSPYSIRTALAMTFAGARGETARQMKETLCFHAEGPALSAALGELQGRLRSAGDELSVACSLWGQEGASFVPAFLEELEQGYGAPFRQVDFAGSLEPARRAINAWAARETEDHVDELLQEEDLTGETALVLASAIHLDAVWPIRFDPANTVPRPFLLTEREGDEWRVREIEVPTMHQTSRFGHRRAEGVSVLELPFSGDALSLVLLVPEDPGGLAALEQRLDGKLLARLVAELERIELAVYLPKFEARTRFRLKETLAALGMPNAFDGGRADFSGMSAEERLCIDAVIHESVVQVDEEGTRAAGATAVVMKKGGGAFHADRGFLLLIRERKTGTTLFLGRVVDPRRP